MKRHVFPLGEGLMGGQGLRLEPRIAPSSSVRTITIPVTDGIRQEGAGTFRYALQQAEIQQARHPHAHVVIKIDPHIRALDVFGPSPVVLNRGLTVAGPRAGVLILTDAEWDVPTTARLERVSWVPFENLPVVLDSSPVFKPTSNLA